MCYFRSFVILLVLSQNHISGLLFIINRNIMEIIYDIASVFKGAACLILAVSRELMEQKPPVLQLAAASSALLTPQL